MPFLKKLKINILFRSHLPLIWLFTSLCSGILSGCGDSQIPAKLFEEVSLTSGMAEYTGMTHGAAWGDYDRDGLPDLYLTNHLNEAKLYRNQGGGRFADVSYLTFKKDDLQGDKHGAQWADYDNDGQLDLVQLTGAVRGVGQEPKRLFRNQNGKFKDVARKVGVENLLGRTRIPLWVDFNGDGRLDLFQGAEQRLDDKLPPFVYLQKGNIFIPAPEELRFETHAIPFCIVTQLNQDYHPEILCRTAGKGAKRTAQIFDTGSVPAKAIDLLPATAFEDVAAGDFDNDGQIDLFLARKNPPAPVAFGRPGSNELLIDLMTNQANLDQEIGLRFVTQGRLKITVYPAWPHEGLTPERIYLGNLGIHPSSMAFSVSKETAGIEEFPKNLPNEVTSLQIALTPPDTWTVKTRISSEALRSGKTQYQNIHVQVVSSDAITRIEPIGSPRNNELAPARLFMNHAGSLVEEGEKRGINRMLTSGTNAVTADFDNDMDLDIFVLNSGVIGNLEDLLLLNRGNGYFDVVRNAGGAAGHRIGVGDAVTTADYDRDGFMDLLVADGGSMGRSLGLPSSNGVYRLYHNIGNDNHWLEIDLEGTDSNRDGIGAKVQIMSGGVTQTRIQDGGLHNRGQNHARLHFGLAQNQIIDQITIHWPSGNVQTLENVQADQVLHILEKADDATTPRPLTSDT